MPRKGRGGGGKLLALSVSEYILYIYLTWHDAWRTVQY